MLSVGVQDTIGFEYRALNSDVKFRNLELLSKSDLNAFEKHSFYSQNHIRHFDFVPIIMFVLSIFTI